MLFTLLHHLPVTDTHFLKASHLPLETAPDENMGLCFLLQLKRKSTVVAEHLQHLCGFGCMEE